MWSLGVLLLVMTTGQVPFNAKNPLNVYKTIAKGHWAKEEGLKGDEKLIGLLSLLLTEDPSKRGTVSNLTNHDWFVKCPALKEA